MHHLGRPIVPDKACKDIWVSSYMTPQGFVVVRVPQVERIDDEHFTI